MIHNKQYEIILEEAKLLNIDYKLPLDFSSTVIDPIKMNNSLWIGELEHWMNEQYLIEACKLYGKLF